MVTRGKPVSVLAYTAGVVDSDGYIGMNKQDQRRQRYWNPKYQTEIVVTNTSYALMEYLTGHWGGSIQTRRKVLEHHKTTYSWKTGDQNGAALCRAIEQYLLIKRSQALLVIEMQDAKHAPRLMGKGAKLSVERVENYERIYQEFRRLNDDRRPQRLSEGTPDAL